jgi:hypothetical protein
MELEDPAFSKLPASVGDVLNDPMLNLLDVSHLQNCVNCEKCTQELEDNSTEFEHAYTKILKWKKICERQRKYYLCAVKYLQESEFARVTGAWDCPCCRKKVVPKLVYKHAKVCFMSL